MNYRLPNFTIEVSLSLLEFDENFPRMTLELCLGFVFLSTKQIFPEKNAVKYDTDNDAIDFFRSRGGHTFAARIDVLYGFLLFADP